MDINQDKVKKVLNELETQQFFGKDQLFPKAFYERLNDEERAEVVKQYRRKNKIGKPWNEES